MPQHVGDNKYSSMYTKYYLADNPEGSQCTPQELQSWYMHLHYQNRQPSITQRTTIRTKVTKASIARILLDCKFQHRQLRYISHPWDWQARTFSPARSQAIITKVTKAVSWRHTPALPPKTERNRVPIHHRRVPRYNSIATHKTIAVSLNGVLDDHRHATRLSSHGSQHTATIP